MKQILICKKDGEYASSADGFDATSVGDGSIAFVDNSTGEVLTDAPFNNFSIVLGRPENKQPIVIPEVDIKTLTVAISVYTPGRLFNANFIVPTPIVGYTYTAIFAKKGVVFNERNKWTATVVANSTDPADVVAELARQINASTETSGLEAEVQDDILTVRAANGDYNVILADELSGVNVNIHSAMPTILDAEWVKDLASQCAAGKGFNYLAEDGKEIYPGYPKELDSETYAMLTLRFAVPRASAKTRDEVVNQLVHIVVPYNSQSGITENEIIEGMLDVIGDYVTVWPED